jgi:hypothetical protein
MEKVLADKQFLALLEAPDDEQAWAWHPPATVQLLHDCPPHLVCHPEGDYFTQSWLEMMGQAGPLADSVVFCGNNAVLRLPNMPRLPGQELTVDEEAATQNVANMPGPSSEELARQAVANAIDWSHQNGLQIPSDNCRDPLFD